MLFYSFSISIFDLNSIVILFWHLKYNKYRKNYSYLYLLEISKEFSYNFLSFQNLKLRGGGSLGIQIHNIQFLQGIVE